MTAPSPPPTPPLERLERILVIRRDNIGDLLCTTPLLTALHRAAPRARITVLANSYNAPVLTGNPDIHEVCHYTKGKHGDGRLLSAWRQFALYRALRARRFELVIHANPTPHPRTQRLVRFLAAPWRLGVVDPGADGIYNLPVPVTALSGTHHVERVFSLLAPLGIGGVPGPLTLIPPVGSMPLPRSVGLHLSSRKPRNRWPLEHYARLGEALLAQGWRVHLFWAPGSRDNRLHPGDDEFAHELATILGGRARLEPTHTLPELIAAMARMARMVTPDGGALHLAAGLGKPMVALFGCTDPRVWGPWGVPHRLLEGDGAVAAIAPDRVLAALESL